MNGPISALAPASPRMAAGEASASPLLRSENLSLAYGPRPAFNRVSLSLPARRITAIVGPSGCGKSSFLLSLNRLTDLIASCRVSGRIWFGGEDIRSETTDVIALRRRIGMIFQQPIPFPLSIGKNIAFPLREHGVKNRKRSAEITESVLRDVGLWEEVKDRLDRPSRILSGGQQQRLCIARAIALEPEVLLMDEPCAALDPLSSGVVEDLVVRLKTRYTILLVTHNLAQARRIADFTAFFWRGTAGGELIEHGPTHTLFSAPRHPLTEAYFKGLRG